MTLRPDDVTEVKLYEVCLRTRDPRIRRGKPSLGEGNWRCCQLVNLHISGQKKMLTVLEGKLLAGSVVRGRIDFSYLPVAGKKTICLLEGYYMTET